MKLVSVAIILIGTFSSLSCIKEDNDNCRQCENKLIKVSFKGSYMREGTTKSSSLMPEGIESIILAYNAGDNPTKKSIYPGTPLFVKSDINGYLTVNNDKNIMMPTGDYDFYAISTNSSFMESLILRDGVYEGLTNGKDYLWASQKEMKIKSETDITFNFEHKATAFTLNFYSGKGIDSLFISKIFLNQCLEGGKLSLLTGKIIPSNCLSAEIITVKAENNSCKWIMLPLSGKIDIPIIVDVIMQINGKIISKKIGTSIPAMDNGFLEGVIYVFNIIVDAESISFSQTSVEEWNEEKCANLYFNEPW